ncbi:U3 small nucleolar RNA-associated protein 4 homolog isoform X2 [Littorina saxatilis]|uniref:Cirhin n=1 Tax=Littorina saxatilis TaxID=31220 RepID=A0AAN9BXY0_9CAEN
MGEFKVHHVRFMSHKPLAIHCMAFEKTSKRLALSRSDGSVEIWSKPDNWLQEKVISVCEERSVEGLVWLDRRLFSVGLDSNVVEYDLATLQIKRQAPSFAGAMWCVTKDEEEHQLAAGTEDGCVVLFDASNDDLQYLRAFDKLEGRILCIAWHAGESVIVTGGPDNIRIWGVKSGHALQRILLGGKDTTVWCLAVTSDLTIISGDSRGKISFWNGKQGTRITHFQSHKADVLTLCVDEEETSVFCSGVDPLVVQYSYMAPSANSGWRSWVRTSCHTYHTHDVRASVVADAHVVTGGMDTNIIVSQTAGGKKRKFTKIPAIPSQSMVSVAKDTGLLLLRHPTFLELWRLGSTKAESDVNGDILPLRTSQLKLLQLQARSGERIACSAISQDGTVVAFSDQEKLRVHKLTLAELKSLTPSVAVARLSLPSKDNIHAAQRLVISPDKHLLVAASSSGSLQIWDISDDTGCRLAHTIPPADSSETCKQSFTNLCVSDNSKFAATSDTDGNVKLYNIKEGEVVCALPTLTQQATALAFTPASRTLLVTYSNHTVYEFDVSKEEYTAWSRDNSHRFPDQWLRQRGCLRGVTSQPADPHRLLLHNEQTIFVINRQLPMPESNYSLLSKGNKGDSPRALIACSKYKFLLHVDCLSEDTLVVVECTPIAIQDSLQQPLQQKKFGT